MRYFKLIFYSRQKGIGDMPVQPLVRSYLLKRIIMLVFSFAAGGCLLVVLSMIQKILIGAPVFILKGYLVPVFFGGTSGVLLGLWIIRLKAANREKEREKENLRVTLDSIGDAVIALDVNGNITRMNPVAAKLTGWKLEEAMGLKLHEIFVITDSGTSEKIEFPLHRIIDKKEVIHLTDNIVLKNKSGEVFYIEDSAAPIFGSKGLCIGVIIVFKDITEKHMMKEMLLQKQKMEAMGNLAGGVAHDFNNMITGIFGFTDLLLAHGPDEKCRRYIDMIVKIAGNAASLTEDLLTFARKSELNFSTHSLKEIMKISVELIRHSTDRSIEIIENYTAGDVVLSCDISKVENAVLNLGLNARDAMPDGGTITIEAGVSALDEAFSRMCSFDIVPGYFARISVRDTGIGMSSDTQNKIFDPFFTTKDPGKGTGLGLAAVYGTVKEHHGVVTVHSEVGKGTVFNIYLPFNKNSELMDSEKKETVEMGYGRVLICDDDEMVRTIGYEILSEIGYEVVLAEGGQECIEIFRENYENIDLVILDMVMGGMDGSECFREMKKIDPDVRILVCSGSVRDSSLQFFRESGFSGFLEKPFRRWELGNMVHNLLN